MRSGPTSILLGAQRKHWHRIEVENALGAWVDLTRWWQSFTFGDDQDSGAGSGTLTLRREAMASGVLTSLAPLIESSSFNTPGGAFSPLLGTFRRLRVSAGATLPGASAPTLTPVFYGVIDDPQWGGRASRIDVNVRDAAAPLQDAIIDEERDYGTDAGTPIADVMQAILDDNGFGALSVAVLGDTQGWSLQPYTQKRGVSVWDALRELALQMSWDFRFWWNGSTYAPTLRDPRTHSAPDLSLTRAQFLDVTRLRLNATDVRNTGELRYYDREAEEYKTVTSQDLASVGAYDVRRFGLLEEQGSQIDTEAEAQQYLDGAVADLSTPFIEQDATLPYLWVLQLGDVLGFPGGTPFYDVGQSFGVVGYRHTITPEKATTSVTLRGRPVGAFRRWLARIDAGTPTPDVTGDPLRLQNFREIGRDDRGVTDGWDDGDLAERCREIWVWSKTLPQDSTDKPWPEPGTDADGNPTFPAPTQRLDPTTREITTPWAPYESVTYVQVVPMTKALRPGDAQRVTVNSVGQPPRFGKVTQTPSVSGLDVTLTVEIIDPQAWGGKFRVWTNHDDVADAVASGPPEGVATIPSTPYTATGATPFDVGLGTLTLLAHIRVQPNRGKRVFFEFVNEKGVSSGVLPFTILASGGGIIDADGNLVDAAINAARQFADGLRPPRVVTALPSDGGGAAVGEIFTLVDADHPAGVLMKWTGTGWESVVRTPDLDGQVLEHQIADAAISTAKFAAGIAPVRLIADRTASGSEDDVALDMATGALVRYRSGAWTDEIPAPSIVGALTGAQIGAGAVGAVQLAVQAVGTVALALGAVTSAIVAAGAIATTNIAPNAITTPKLAAGAVVTASLAAGAVTANEIAAGAITTAKLAAGAVTAATIAAGAVTATAIAAASITAGALAANAVTAGTIAANAVTSATIAAGAITTGKLGANAVTAGTVAAGAISTTELAANAVTTAKLAAGSVTATQLAANSVTAGAINAGAITTVKLAAGAVTANELAVNAVTAASIAAGAVTATAIAAKAVKATHLEVSVLSDVKDASGNTLGLGIIVSGRLNAVATGGYIDLNASGSGAFIHHPQFDLFANGNASFGGIVSAQTFTSTDAQFSGSVTLNTAGFTGTQGMIKFYDPAAPFSPQATISAWPGNALALTNSSHGVVLSVGFGTVAAGTGGLTVNGGEIFANVSRWGIFGTTPAPKQNVAGSRAGNAALQSLLTAVAAYGWINDFTSA